MAAVGLGVAAAEAVMARAGERATRCVIACDNSPASVTLAGARIALNPNRFRTGCLTACGRARRMLRDRLRQQPRQRHPRGCAQTLNRAFSCILAIL